MCQFIEKGDEHISRISLSDKKDGTEDEAEDLTSSSARRREESHRTAALSWGFQVDRLPSHHTVRIGVGPADGSSPGSATSQLSLPPPAPGTPIVCQSRTPTPTPRVGFASGPPTPTDSDFSGHGHGLGVTFTASPVVVVCTEGTPWFQSGRTLILEPPVSGARLHWGRNQCANIDIHICAVFGDKCVELPL